jgi:hypothetical protein
MFHDSTSPNGPIRRGSRIISPSKQGGCPSRAVRWSRERRGLRYAALHVPEISPRSCAAGDRRVRDGIDQLAFERGDGF